MMNRLFRQMMRKIGCGVSKGNVFYNQNHVVQGLWCYILLMSTTDTLEEFIQAVDKVDGLQKEARAFLEYGKEHEGYWTAKKILFQLEVAAKIANIK